MTARREKGKFLVFRVFAEMCIGSQSARGMAMFAEPLPRIISGSRGLVYPLSGGLRGFSICRLRVNRTSDSSPSGEYSARWLYLYYEPASSSARQPLTAIYESGAPLQSLFYYNFVNLSCPVLFVLPILHD